MDPKVSNAAPKLKLVDAEKLVDDPTNARLHSSDQVRHLANLILRFGWTRPIQVDVEGGNVIVVGHGARAAASLIYSEGGRIHAAPGPERGGPILPAGKVPILDVSGWTEDERRAVNLADNRSAEMSEWSEERLAQQVASLVSAEFDPSMLGFDPSAVDEMLAGLANAANAGPTPPEQFPEYGDDIETEHRCPKCGYEWSGKAS